MGGTCGPQRSATQRTAKGWQRVLKCLKYIEDIPQAKLGTPASHQVLGRKRQVLLPLTLPQESTSSCLALQSSFQSPHEQFQVLRSSFLQGFREPPILHRSMQTSLNLMSQVKSSEGNTNSVALKHLLSMILPSFMAKKFISI